MGRLSKDNPYRIFPPHLMILAAIAMHILGRIETGQSFAHFYGLPLCAFAVWMAFREKNRFIASGTTFFPGERSEKLVTGGAYKYTRNPMYLAMVLLLVGLWPLTGGWTPVIPNIMFIALIQHYFIRREERMLTEAFGEEYLAYKASVRRWI